ncbi:TRAP transporter large permease subunit [Vineibacter terrae]|uniref:TRAP transporter large permease protein n=1 Tax=Vineibacter terrae TaxID=2586908 RepID=A0A5C8PB08_9HYPH|nr:TRAP transporter large permease subunit [Vineibacter terrae]TXL70230.1 TRAP transporter large permease subunit [Vineibacter terrae]
MGSIDAQIALLAVAALFFLFGTGVWIGLSMIGVSVAVMWIFAPAKPAGDAMATTIFSDTSSWTLTALPLFIWMGEVLFRTAISEDMFRGLAPWMRRLPGRLVHTNIIGCSIFAAVSGSSAATCATIGKMTVPELKRRGYPDEIAIGSLSGAGTLGLLIPPSLIMIVYGVQADVSVAKLFAAGVIPGVLLAGLMMAYVAGWAMLNPSKVPPPDAPLSLAQKLHESRTLIPVVLLILLVLGSIYAGIATATESAAFGVVGSFAIAGWQRRLDWRTFWDSVMGATRLTAMILLILAGASYLKLAMGFTGLPRHLAESIAAMNLSPAALIVVLAILYIILGCFLDGISMVVLTIAIVLPMVEQAGIDKLWFGIFITIVVEMAQITPPVGFNLFVLQGMTGKSIFWIGRVSLPFFIAMNICVVLLYQFPALVHFLPDLMVSAAR